MASKSSNLTRLHDDHFPAAVVRTGRATLRWLSQVDSTNTALKTLARSGATEWTGLCADEQTAGRGQYGRTWHSPAGAGLYLSLLFRPSLTSGQIVHVTTFAGLVIHQVLSLFVGDQSRLAIKAPNDVLLDGRKVAGILVEADWQENTLNFLIIGIGINVNHLSFPDGLRYPATSLRLALGDAAPTRETVLQHILETFDTQWDTFVADPGGCVASQREGVVCY
ncbi:MAG: biotin--[acetyl-CoA-carboxylase] ligase [Chloracidobacterium sp.]